MKCFLKILKSSDAYVIFVMTSTPVTYSDLGNGLIVEPISIGVASNLTISKRITFEKICDGKKKQKKQNDGTQKTTVSSDKF